MHRQLVPTNLNLLEVLAVQLEVDREAARTQFPNALLDQVPDDARFYVLSISPRDGVLVAHHSVERLETHPPQEGPGVWDLWTGDSYWSQLNRAGERL